jgi:hypothetical protein
MPKFYSWAAPIREFGPHVNPEPRYCERSEAIQESLAVAELLRYARNDGGRCAYPGILTGSDSYPLMKLE